MEKLDELMTGINPLNAKARTAEIAALLDKFIPSVAKMNTQMKKFTGTLKDLRTENKELTAENAALAEKSKISVIKEMATIQLRRDYDDVVALLQRIPPEVLAEYRQRGSRDTSRHNSKEECL